MKKFLNIIFWISFLAYYFIAMNYVSAKRHELVCTNVEVVIIDSLKSRFVTADYISQMIDNRKNRIGGEKMDSINTRLIEQQINNYAPVRFAEVYKTINGTVHVDVVQRAPVLRIINRAGENYYLDENGEALQHSGQYCTHILVANGYINQTAPGRKGFNVTEMEIPHGKRSIIRELFDLAVYINNDKFRKAQIQQIYVNKDGEFELIPRIGAHVILFGTFERPEKKFAYLESLYRNGLNVTGWNKYDVINLKYEGQIVCTKR